MNIRILLSAALLLSASASADEINGTLVQDGAGCILVELPTGERYIPDDGGAGLAMGTLVHVSGDLDPSCGSICFANNGCIWNAVTTAGWTIDACGTLVQDGAGCILVELPTGERYIPDDGGAGYPVGTTLRVRGDLDPSCGSICFANNGCIWNAISTLDCAGPSVGTPYCFGDGSATAPPCGNFGAAGNGAANGSNTAGANLSANGTASVSASTVVLSGAGSPPNQPGLFFQGDVRTNGGMGLIFGDGLRCAGGNVVRLEVVTPDVNGDSATSFDLAVKGGAMSGQTLYYQLWYRDPLGSPCGALFNTTNALEITWAN